MASTCVESATMLELMSASLCISMSKVSLMGKHQQNLSVTVEIMPPYKVFWMSALDVLQTHVKAYVCSVFLYSQLSTNNFRHSRFNQVYSPFLCGGCSCPVLPVTLQYKVNTEAQRLKDLNLSWLFCDSKATSKMSSCLLYTFRLN